MAKATLDIIKTLRKTAETLESSDQYQWGHMGSCNCGFLAQQITKLRKNEIHERAMQRYGDWSEQLHDYCATSGLPMDDLISEMVRAGFDTDDLKNLERLSDSTILHSIPLGERNLKHNYKPDVIRYLKAWADVLENQLLDQISLKDLTQRSTIL